MVQDHTLCHTSGQAACAETKAANVPTTANGQSLEQHGWLGSRASQRSPTSHTSLPHTVDARAGHSTVRHCS